MLHTTMPRARQAATSTLSVPVAETRHQPQPGELADDGRGKRNLVDDRDRGLPEKRGDFSRRDAIVLGPGVRERRPANIRFDRTALEENDVLDRFPHG
jgi:hypothetical protein